MSELPAWVYDVVMAMEKWSYEHPRLFVEYFNQEAGKHVMQPAVGCGCAALDFVPKEVRDYARAIAAYMAAKTLEADDD